MSEIPDTLLLAALDRAVRHSREGMVPAPWAVRADLGISASSGEWRQVRRQLRALESAGLVEAGRRNGVPVWSVTAAGREQLGDVELPESPQHRRWREAHESAERLDGRFRRELVNTLDDARALLSSGVAATSDTWFELGDRLQYGCQRVGSARYCLHEWGEPDDGERDEPKLSRAGFITDRAGGGGDA